MTRRSFVREAAVFAFFIAASVLVTWPLATHLHTAVPDIGDPLLNTWILDWVMHALTHSPLHVFDASIFYPAKYPLAFSENMLGVAIFGLPFHLAGLAPLTVYNLLVLLGFTHAGYGASVLGRSVTRSIPARLVAGIFFAFCAFKFDHLSHIQILWSGWLPLLLAALIAFWRKPAPGRAALLSGAFLMNGLTNIHFMLFGGVAVALTIALMMIERADFRALGGAVTALAIASALLVPVLLPYRAISHQYGAKRNEGEVREGSATWDDWLRVTSRNRFYGAIEDPDIGRAERQLFPGLLALGLTGFAFFILPRRGRTAGSGLPAPRWLPFLDTAIVLLAMASWAGAVAKKFVLKPWHTTLLNIDNAAYPTTLLVVLIVARLVIRLPRAMDSGGGRSLRDTFRDSRFPPALKAGALWIFIGVLGSFGLNAFFHSFLYRQVEAFSAIRAAARWAIVAYAGFVPWAAMGASELIAGRRRPWSRQLTAAILLVVAFVDVAVLVRWEQVVPEPPPFYRWLQHEQIEPIIELPMHNDVGAEFLYVFYSATHHMKSVNGTSGWEPPIHRRLRTMIEQGRLDETFTRGLERFGVKLVVLHPGQMGNQQQATLAWAAREVAEGRLKFIRRFDHSMSGDWVLAITKNLPEWPRYVENARDAAGFRQSESFERMLRGDTTYNNITFSQVEAPKPYEAYIGPMQVSGWALSPSGIREINVLLNGGEKRYPATLFARPDVSALFPWYPNVSQPGFIVRLKKRPKGIPRQTDVQIEIIDGAGRTTRLTDVPLYWD